MLRGIARSAALIALIALIAVLLVAAVAITPPRELSGDPSQLRIIPKAGSPAVATQRVTIPRRIVLPGVDPAASALPALITSPAIAVETSRVAKAAATVEAATAAPAVTSTPAPTPDALPADTTPPETASESTTTPTPGTAAAAYLMELAHAFMDLQRALFTLEALIRSSDLDVVAQAHADDLASSGRFSHTGSGGITLADRLAAVDVEYDTAGENLGRSSHADADAVRAIVAGFMNSSAHRANVLARAFEAVGFGLARSVDGSAILVVVFSD